MAQIVPGILTADEDEYQKKLRLAEHSASLIQIDIVDGKFSANKTVGIDTVAKFVSSSSLEIQLMVEKPNFYLNDLIKLDFVSRIIFPFETNDDIGAAIYTIRKSQKQAGISLNPETPLISAMRFFDDVDLLLLMTGKPGYSGQKLGPQTYNRIIEAKKLAPSLPIEIDIGVNFENAAKLAKSGADFLVASSALFNTPDFNDTYCKLAKLAKVRT
jgi:ribulose-phosphate 3-epimerase